MIRKNKENINTPSSFNSITEGRILWKNNGGTLRLRKNKIIKPGEKFKAYPHEIPKAFRDVIIALEPVTDFKEVEMNIPSITYTLKPSDENEGFFDIYNSQNKKMNELPLEEEVAKQLIKDLQS